MGDAWTQERLDQWLGLDEEAHRALRSGRLPKSIVEGGAKVTGCLSVFAGLVGGAIGLGFGFGMHSRFGEAVGLGRTAFAIACAAAFAVAVVALFRRQWAKLGSLEDLSKAPVRCELLELSMESTDGRRTIVTASDGRRFFIAKPSTSPFAGRFRTYYIDIAKVGGMSASEGGIPDLFIVGLQVE